MRRADIREIPGHEGFAIALIVVAICVVCTVGGAAWRPQLPVSYARAEPAISTKKHDRLTQASPPMHFVTTEVIKPRPVKLSELVASPWPCERIREAVARFGIIAVRAYAKARGYSKKQIDEALACLATEKRS